MKSLDNVLKYVTDVVVDPNELLGSKIKANFFFIKSEVF